MRSRAPRGFSLLIALGMVAAFTVAALLSLTYVSQSNETQGQSRRSKEAFFAAEAGLAEAKERLRILAGASTNYNNVMATLGQYPIAALDHPQPPPALNNEWYQLIAPSNYGLTRVSAFGPVAAVDDTVIAPNREMNTPAGAAFADYPAQNTVSYRVFLRDDFDETIGLQDQTTDANGKVWLVAIGQVQQSGGRPVQAVVSALVTNGSATGGVLNGTSQRVTNIASTEVGAPAAGAINLN